MKIEREFASAAFASVVVTALIASAYWFGFGLFSRVETACDELRSCFGRHAVADSRLAFCSINQSSFLKLSTRQDLQGIQPLRLMAKGFPWSREVWAAVLNRLVEAKAKIVVFDLLFDSEREGDDSFKETLERNKERVIISCKFERQPGVDQVSLILPARTVLGEQMHDDCLTPEGVAGHINVFPDADEVIRRFKNRLSLNDFIPSGDPTHARSSSAEILAVKALRKAGNSNVLERIEENQRFRYARSRYVPISIFEIFDPLLWRNKYQEGKFFENKIVIIGVEGEWAGDMHKVPCTETMPGAEIQLNIMGAILQGELLREIPLSQGVFLICLAGGGALFGSVGTRKLFLGAFLGNILYVMLALAAYNYWNLVLPVFYPLAAFNSSILVNYLLLKRRKGAR